jgi:hypothetical protein
MSDEQEPAATMAETARELAAALSKFADTAAAVGGGVPDRVQFALQCEHALRDFVQDGDAWKAASDDLREAVMGARVRALSVISAYLEKPR